MSPPFLFRIDEITESSNAMQHLDTRGNWVPSTDAGANIRVPGGASGIWWYCDRQRIYASGLQAPPQGSSLYKDFSLYYSGGMGFWVLRGDATRPTDDNWHPLRFDHMPNDYSSFLTNAGQNPTLRVQRTNQQWPAMLLPDIYHTTTQTEASVYGGLIGELPILLGLIAFSTSPEFLSSILPMVFTDGAWRTHMYQQPRTHQRGVVVTIYTCPSSWARGSTAKDLSQYEHGAYGKYYN